MRQRDTHDIVAVCRKTEVRFSITVRQHARLRNRIEAIPEADWTPILYWMEGAADVAETEYTPFSSEPDAVPVGLIVRRVKPTPGSQLALFASYSYHAFITDRVGEALALEADHRRHAEIENAIRDLKYGVRLNHLPSGRFSANAAWLAVQIIAHNLARWTSRIALGRAGVHHQDPPTTLLLHPRTPHPQGPPARPASSPGLALAKPIQLRPGRDCAPFRFLPDRADDDVAADRPTHRLEEPHQVSPRVSPAAVRPGNLVQHPHRRRQHHAHVVVSLPNGPRYLDQPTDVRFHRRTSPLRPASPHHFGGFGLRLSEPPASQLRLIILKAAPVL